MIQIILSPNPEYSLPEMAQMAVEAGAMWLVLLLPEDAADMRDDLTQVVQICRDSGVILTTDNIAVARELSLHGIFIDGAVTSPVKLRDDFGAEAIIGAIIGSADTAGVMQRADIDYVALRPSRTDTPAIISAIRAAGCDIPVVAYIPDMKPDAASVRELLRQGFTGICAGKEFFNGTDPVADIKKLLGNSI